MSIEPSSSNSPCQHDLPSGWREVTLASVADVRFSGVDKLSIPSEEPVRLCNYTDVYNNDYITRDLQFMQATAAQAEIARFGLQLGDVIVTKDSETPDAIGIPAVVDYGAPDLVCGYHLALLRPVAEKVDPTFLAKQLRHHRIARYFGQKANGLTRYGLPTAVVANIPLWLPELAEQKAIGAILRLVDEAIVKTEAVVAKLKQVRAGLLHDLLTRGLDEHGQLRDPIAHPEQFKDSPLGQIPREWEVSRLSEGSDTIGDGAHVSVSTVSDGYPFLYVSCVRDGNILWGNCAYVTERTMRELNRGKSIGRGTVLYTVVGSYGHAAAIADDSPFGFQRHIAFINPKASKLHSSFLVLWLNSPQARQHADTIALGNAQKTIPLTMLAKIPMPQPTIGEQERIVSASSSVESALVQEQRTLDKLTRLKSGLMTDLLTGRVRVPEGSAVTS